jgi:putative mycofactocin binding protein MftB
VRPEPFGALVYHFGTRRLTFLKSRLLLDVVRALADHETARDACRAAGVPEEEMPRYETALATLADTGMITPRSAS